MVEKVLKKFEIKYLQILDETGHCDEKLKPKLTNAEIKKMYELMVVTRIFDKKALAMQRQGRMGTYASVLGQEAAQIGSAFPMNPKDWLFPAFRESGALITRSTPMSMILQYWAGDERGSKSPKDINNFPSAVPVGTQILHATGTGWGMRMKKQKTAAVVYFGDGATSRVDFHEGLNFAGVFKANTVFVCQNNQYAISLPFAKQTAAETVAQKAIAYGFEGIRVDGNDIFAVYKATKNALEKARAGRGPTLIECFTYRRGDHTTSDDASRYRTKKEVELWEKKDPIDRLKKYMQKKKIWTQAYEKSVIAKYTKLVEEAVKKEEAIPKPDLKDIFSYMYAKMPKHLEEQMKSLEESLEEEK
ncbi:MAG: pyruvate dehydrogenase (acetyl-transferring) E1 component subunit alpha [Candidatus Aenigmatarchaeota archaeon]